MKYWEGTEVKLVKEGKESEGGGRRKKRRDRVKEGEGEG